MTYTATRIDCKKESHCVPKPNQSPLPEPTTTVHPSVSPNPSELPIHTPIPTTTATPVATASSDPTPTAVPTEAASATTGPRTDLTDGRSDGRTESLACLRPSDGCGATLNVATLPVTGSNQAITILFIAGSLFIVGVTLLLVSYFEDKKKKAANGN